MPSRRLALVVVAAFAAAGAAAAASGAQAQPLIPAMLPNLATTPSANDVAQMKNAGVRVVRLLVDWSTVAPGRRPTTFDAADPADPAYDWGATDEAVTTATGAGFQPILDVVGAPAWAARAPATPQGADGNPRGPLTPSAAALAQFATALATRYGGAFDGLPRVHYWQLYNEPNLDQNLRPQIEGGRPASPALYRRMVNAFAHAIHDVHTDNLAIAGGLTPFTFRTGKTQHSIAPLRFMRDFLCMSAGAHPHPTCGGKVEMDVWSHHPYTSGGPTHKAANPDDVSLGDLPAMHRLLLAAAKAGKIVSRHPPLFWVTEFSWDSSPPDSAAVPVSLLMRWVPQAMYEMWLNGVSLVTWFSLRDHARPSFMQSGLYFEDGTPKPYLRGFRFPVVAFPRSRGFYVWGRTPLGERATVVVEQRTVGGWHATGTIRTGAGGIFHHTYSATPTGFVRARLATGQVSIPFSLASVPDKAYSPFGS